MALAFKEYSRDQGWNRIELTVDDGHGRQIGSGIMVDLTDAQLEELKAGKEFVFEPIEGPEFFETGATHKIKAVSEEPVEVEEDEPKPPKPPKPPKAK